MEIDPRPLPDDIEQWEGHWIALADDGTVLGAWHSTDAVTREVPALGLPDDARVLYVKRRGEPQWLTLHWC